MQWRRDTDGKLQCPELFFVGTHHDQETMLSKNECLKGKLLQFPTYPDKNDEKIDHHLSNYCTIGKSDQLRILYPVNAKDPDKNDKKVATDFRQDVVTS